MKKVFYTVLAFAATLASCSQNEITNKDFNNEVKMTASIPQTRAAIAPAENAQLPAEDLQVSFVRVDCAADATPDWSASNSGINALLEGTDNAHAGKIDFNPAQYYKPEANVSHSHFIGYYPASATVGEGKINFTVDGQTDILVSTKVEGDRTVERDLTPIFNHQLTWLKFKIKSLENANIFWGNIQSIEVLGAGENLSYDMANGTAAADAGDVTTYSNDWSTPSAYTLDKNAEATFFSQAMIPAGKSSYQIRVKTATKPAGFLLNVKIKDALNKAQAGTVYDVVLTFTDVTISSVATASITPWAQADEESETEVSYHNN